MYIKHPGKVFSFRTLEEFQDATATVALGSYLLQTPTAQCLLSCQLPLPTTASFLPTPLTTAAAYCRLPFEP